MVWGYRSIICRLTLSIGLLGLASCGSGTAARTQTQSGGRQQGPASPISTAPLVALAPNALPPFPDDRAASGLTETLIIGKDAQPRSSGAVTQGSALQLDALTASAPQYAVYRFNPGGSAPDSVNVLFDETATTAAYVGRANYATGHWEFFGPFAALATVGCDGGDYQSPAGNMTFAIVVPQGQCATVSALSVRTIGPDNQPPVAALAADVTSGKAPLTVQFDASGSSDPDGSLVEYAWDFDGNGTYEQFSDGPTLSHTFYGHGLVTVKVRVTDDQFARAVATQEISLVAPNNNPPTARVSADRTSGYAPLLVALDASASSTGDGSGDKLVRYDWDWDSDGTYEYSAADPTVTRYFDAVGAQLVTVRVTDLVGYQSTAQITLQCAAYGGLAPNSSPETQSGPSLLLVGGNPALSFFDLTSGRVKYQRALDPQGSAWDAPVVVDFASGVETQSTSLYMVNGRPAIAYSDSTTDSLLFVRAGDALGTNWLARVQVASSVSKRTPATLVMAGGRPAIAFAQSEKLAYVRALDADGTSWGSVQAPDGSSTQQLQPSLTIINGNPALTYIEYDQPVSMFELRYLRALDSAGATWGSPVVLSTDINSSNDSSVLTIAAGNPALAFGTRNGVFYRRATDPDGTGWGPLLKIGLGNAEQSQVALSSVNGLPAVAYCAEQAYGSPEAIYFATATDAAGSAWEPGRQLDGLAPASMPALLEVDGEPAVAYLNTHDAWCNVFYFRDPDFDAL